MCSACVYVLKCSWNSAVREVDIKHFYWTNEFQVKLYGLLKIFFFRNSYFSRKWSLILNSQYPTIIITIIIIITIKNKDWEGKESPNVQPHQYVSNQENIQKDWCVFDYQES